MKRLVGAIDKSGNFIPGKVTKYTRHEGYKDENREMQRITHAAELVQPFLPNGEVNENYGILYHDMAIQQGVIDEDPDIDYQKFE